MKKKLTVLMTILTCASAGASVNKVIYGEDDRTHLNDSELAIFKELARATAGMIPNTKLEKKFDGLLTLVKGETLEKAMRVCKDEKFSQVMTAANCSGFLVGKNLLVTAGHCITSEAACKNNQWVFDFRQDLLKEGETELYVNSDNVYGCKKIISQSLSRVSKNDYALIELDRDVTDREPLKFRSEGKIETNDPLVVIGHPSGLPTIIADGANVRTNDNDFFFQANLDTFGGNSGSAVFNAKTNTVEGILVRGERDYAFDPQSGCNRVFKCKDDECRGEDVTRITVIPELAPGMTPEEPVIEEEELDNPFAIPGLFPTEDCNPFIPGSCPDSLFN
ncbi:MAG: endopeptidase [Halobacteriovorax sp.]|nr:endopeptidase [Halobacteriovorax sp.]|tara:strand:+ start:46717 stop:47721 length:1005 start_codon:yes stop_codon:yes gene_type:complete